MQVEIKKALDAESTSLISQIGIKLRERSLFQNNRKVILLLLDELESHLNIRLCPFLLAVSLDKGKEISEKTGSIIHTIVTSLTYKDVKSLDKIFRNTYFGIDLDLRLDRLSFPTLQSRIKQNKYVEELTCLLTLSGNGYLRELALRLIKNATVSQSSAFIVLRLNDWVPEVRDEALKGINLLLSTSKGLERLLDVLPLLDSLLDWQRSSYLALQLHLNSAFLDLKNRKTLLLKYHTTTDFKIRRSLFNVLIQDTSNFNSILQHGLNSRDPVIIKKCIAYTRQNYDAIDIPATLETLKRSKAAPCKIAYIELASNTIEQSLFKNHLELLIYDKVSSVRALARTKLRELEPTIDFWKLYKENLYKAHGLNTRAFRGLTDICTISDYGCIKPFLNNEERVVRILAVATLYRLDKERSKDDVIDFLCSEDEVESKTITRLLSTPVKVRQIAIELFELIDLDDFAPHVYMNIVYLLHYASKWTSIVANLKIIALQRPVTNNQITFEITRWLMRYNRSFIAPSQQEIFELKNAYSRSRVHLSEHHQNELDAIITHL